MFGIFYYQDQLDTAETMERAQARMLELADQMYKCHFQSLESFGWCAKSRPWAIKQVKAPTKKSQPDRKEYLYVGHYIDTDGNYILKVGTTNNLERRRKEHTRNYRRAGRWTMPENASFTYDWSLPLSKYNTLRFEDKTRAAWQDAGIGEFVRNDRFVCHQKPESVTVTIRKTYQIALA